MTYHAASMHQLLSPVLLQSQESTSQVCDRPCPFCQREYERPIDLQQHVAGHLESTALLSLPNLDSIEEGSEAGQVNSNSANRNYAESRADDFDRMEPLVFPENDHPEDVPRLTEMNKELFRRRLEVESVPFHSLNEVNVEARQAYSSNLAGEWLSHLPIQLGEESEIRLEPSSNMHRSPSFRRLLGALDQVYPDITEKDKDLDYPSFYEELYTLQRMKQTIVVGLSLQSLSQEQKSKLRALGRDVDNLSRDITSGRFRMKSAQEEMDIIGPRILSLSSQFGVLIAQYVTDARTFDEGLTFCSFPRQFREEAVESGKGLESTGQSRKQSLLANLITPDLSTSDSEGKRAADNQKTATSITISSDVTVPVEPLTGSTPQETLPRFQRTSISNHWLPKVFNQSLQSSPTTLKESTERGSSECFGQHMPDAMTKLDDEAYVSLADFRFHNDEFIVRLYDQLQDLPQVQPYGYSPRILCSTKRPARDRKDSWEPLVALNISRRGSFLDLILNDGVEEPPGLWACIRFPNYESMFRLSLGWPSRYNGIHQPRALQKAQEAKLEGSQ